MATLSPDIPQQQLQQPALSEEEAGLVARNLVKRYRALRLARRSHEVLADKLLAHVSGDQWLDIRGGSLVQIPLREGHARTYDNVLADLVENMSSYHTQNPYRFKSRFPASPEGREFEVVADRFANHVGPDNRLNQTTALALAIGGACFGFHPIHVLWEEEATDSAYPALFDESVSEAAEVDLGYGALGVRKKGRIRFWLGDPWATVADAGATRGNVFRETYERVMPLEVVKEVFGARAATLKPRTDLPGAARFHRVQRYVAGALGPDYAGVARSQPASGEDTGPLVSLVCEETLPCMLPADLRQQFPSGMLTIVALSGGGADDREGSRGVPVFLHRGSLPGGVLGVERFYAVGPGRGADSADGIPWVRDLDELQMRLNSLLSRAMNRVRKDTDPPILIQMGLLDDAAKKNPHGSAFWEYFGGQPPKYLEPPNDMGTLDREILRAYNALHERGGYNAASRGELKAGTSGYAVRQLAAYDDSKFGTAGIGLGDALCSLMKKAHALAFEHMDAPMELTDYTGGDFGYLATPYIHWQQMSPKAPQFELVSGWGTMQDRMERLTSLVQMRGGDGQPLLPVEDFWEKYPDQSMRPLGNETRNMKRRRAKARVAALRDGARALRPQCDQQVQQLQAQVQLMARTTPGGLVNMPQPQQVQQQVEMQCARQLFQQVEQQIPRMRSDDIAFSIDSLDEIVQDVQADRIAVLAASQIQDAYFMVQAQMAQQQMAAKPQRQQQPGAKPGATEAQQSERSSVGMMGQQPQPAMAVAA